MPNPKTVDALEILRKEVEADPELAVMVEEERKKLQLGMTLLELREKAGLTQTQLARRIKSSQPAVARMESGDYERLSLTTLLKVSSALGYSFNIEFTRTKPDKEKENWIGIDEVIEQLDEKSSRGKILTKDKQDSVITAVEAPKEYGNGSDSS